MLNEVQQQHGPGSGSTALFAAQDYPNGEVDPWDHQHVWTMHLQCYEGPYRVDNTQTFSRFVTPAVCSWGVLGYSPVWPLLQSLAGVVAHPDNSLPPLERTNLFRHRGVFGAIFANIMGEDCHAVGGHFVSRNIVYAEKSITSIGSLNFLTKRAEPVEKSYELPPNLVGADYLTKVIQTAPFSHRFTLATCR
jgi:hypothetical protein